MRRWAMAMAVLMLVGVGVQDEAWGEAPDDVEVRQDRLVVDERGVEVERPTGWEWVQPPQGARAKLRSASDERAQIEIRVSEDISRGGWERYWRAFDTDLQRRGFTEVRRRESQTYAEKQGLAFEYQIGGREEDGQRLVVWHVHHEEAAWVFTGFFKESRREAFGRSFEEMLESIEWR